MRSTILCLLVVGLLPLGKAEDIYRLPQNVRPNHYKIDLIINELAVTNYNGTVTISLTTLQTTNEIRFHAKNIEIQTVSLTDENGGDVQIGDGPYTSDPITDQIVISTVQSLSGNYVLAIQFEGLLNDGLDGFYLSSYKENGQTKYLGATQFEQVGARKAFPCFDEPSFKSTFDISMTFPQGYNAVGNTPLAGPVEDVDGMLKATFKTTPVMSTYLVAFVVSQFTCTSGVDVQPGTFTEVCSRPDTEKLRGLALDFGPKVLHVIEEYTGVPYGDSGIGKMSQASIPDFAAGAMENWGLVTYQEYMLLYNEDDGEGAKSMVVTTISHEFGHQWFGDLVTLGWWSDVFLNEGFATYFEYFATDKIYPEWNLEESFVTGALEEALYVDAYLDSLPLSYPNVSSPRDSGNRFDSISYQKGGSILRMVQHILGIDNFIAGLKDYISISKLSNTLANDLWNGLAPYADNLPVGTSFVEVMDNWTYRAGYPLLTVVSNGNDVIISQERYLTEAGNDDTKWYVPITYTLSGDDPNDTKPKAWLTPNEDLTLAGVLANSDTIVLNNLQTGYYRVNYDDNLLRKISKALSTKSFSGIHSVNRAQIIDDLFSISKIGLRSYSQVFNFLRYLENETDYTPWKAAFTNFQFLLRKLRNKSLISLFNDYIANLSRNFYQSSSNPQSLTEILKQTLSHTWACKLNEETCVKHALDQFKASKIEQKSPENKDLKNVIYCNGLRYSSEPEEDWNHLWQLLGKSSTARPLIIDSLGCTSNKMILKKYLQKILHSDGIRKHEIERVLSAVYSNSPEGLDVSLDFIVDNYQEIAIRLGKPNRFTAVLKTIADYLTTYEQFEKLTSFVVGAKLEDNIRESLLPEMSKVKRNLDWIENYENQMMEYFYKQ